MHCIFCDLLSHLKWAQNLICGVNWLRNTYFSVIPTPHFPDLIIYKLSTGDNILSTAGFNEVMWHKTQPEAYWANKVGEKRKSTVRKREREIGMDGGRRLIMARQNEEPPSFGPVLHIKQSSRPADCQSNTSVKTTQHLVPLQIKRGIQCRVIKFIPHKPPRHESHLTLLPTEEIFIFPGSFSGIL